VMGDGSIGFIYGWVVSCAALRDKTAKNSAEETYDLMDGM